MVDTRTDDTMTLAALAEMRRLVTELIDRYERAQYIEAMASLAALEPVRSFLLECCTERWTTTELPPDPQVVSIDRGYL